MMDRYLRSDCRSVLEAAPTSLTGLIHSSHEEARPGRDAPPPKQEARAHSNKTLKEAIISGLPIPEQGTGSQIPALPSLPLAVGKIKLLEKSE